MGNAIFDLRALPPTEVLRKFVAALGEAFGVRSVENTIVTTNLISQNHYSFAGGVKANEIQNAQDYRKALEDLAERGGYVNVRTVKSTLPSNNPNQKILFTYETTDDIFAKLTFDTGDEALFRSEVLNVANAISKHFNVTRKAELISQHLPQAEQEKLRYYERALSDLTAAVAKLGDVTTQQIERQASFLQEKSAELDKQASERADKLQKDFESRLEQLAKDREALEKEKQQLDVRRNTAVRRSLVADMRNQIGTKFNVTPETVKRRLPIQLAAITAMIAGAALMAFSMAKLFSLTSFDWRYMATFWSGLALAGTTLIYYLRWNNHWFAQLAQNEFNTRKMDIDVLRASWVAEMLMEWKEEKDKPFPAELLTSVTEGLFRGVDGFQGDHHPVGDASRLIASISKLKVTKDGVEVSKKD